VINPPRFKDALEVFARHDVELIVVGGVAAVIGGAPMATFDVDVVHARNAGNLERLRAALEELDACYRDPAGRQLRPESADLAGPEYQGRSGPRQGSCGTRHAATGAAYVAADIAVVATSLR
jgi:hypothetical protein